MVKKSSAVLACVIVGLCAVAVTASLMLGGFVVYGAHNGILSRTPQVTPGASGSPATLDYSRLDEIRAVLHQEALTDVPDQQLVDGAAKGMVAGTGDVYANYFTADEYKQFNSDEEGKYVGIGASVNVDPKDNFITIVTVYKDSPADKGGLHPGDKLLAVDGKDVTAMTVDEAVKLVKGEAGTEVKLTVQRLQEQLDLTMTRAEVLADRTEWKMLDNNIGYIKIIEFNGNAADLFEKAVNELKDQGAKGFVLDLRNNPGGSYDIVVKIADMLFPSGPIITLEDKDGNKENIATSGPSYLNMPMTVLVNENSASASELLSGGIQDYKVGTLIGTTTYGKGVAQDFYQFPDGAALKYTSHRYLTGGGRCPQGTGITPDITVELDKAVQDDPFLLCTEQDNQYQRAIEELKKMIK